MKLVDLKRTYAKEGRKNFMKNEENWTTMTMDEKFEVPDSSGDGSHKTMTMQRMLNQRSPYYHQPISYIVTSSPPSSLSVHSCNHNRMTLPHAMPPPHHIRGNNIICTVSSSKVPRFVKDVVMMPSHSLSSEQLRETHPFGDLVLVYSRISYFLDLTLFLTN